VGARAASQRAFRRRDLDGRVDTINGLPAHPLLVHLVVVAIPVTAALAILAVAWPAARRRLGLAPLIMAVIALIAIPLATDAGEWLQARKRPSELINRHAELGGQLIYWVAPLTVLLAVWWLAGTTPVANRLKPVSVAARRVGGALLGVAIVVLAVGSAVTVYRIGDSGSQSVWHDAVKQ
jgi:uncharacterized membrane protein